MRAVNAGDVDAALTLLDESHEQLLHDKETLAEVEKALRDLASPGPEAPSRREVIFIGRLARQLGIGAATLRKWEKAGLIEPRRDPETGYRVYSPADVRDARLAHQLRRGGYLLRQISPLIEQVRNAGGVAPLEAALGEWRARLTTRGLSMLSAAAELSAYVEYKQLAKD
jgi:DNA-binding transcriptional MerR regulator